MVGFCFCFSLGVEGVCFIVGFGDCCGGFIFGVGFVGLCLLFGDVGVGFCLFDLFDCGGFGCLFVCVEFGLSVCFCFIVLGIGDMFDVGIELSLFVFGLLL